MAAGVHQVINEIQQNEVEVRKPNIVVTGFGPFEGHPINASWEAVKLLPELNIGNDLNVNLIIEQITVSYDNVERKIPDLWKTYNPLFMIHVGVSGLAKNLTLESCAHKNGYVKCDVEGLKPDSNKCCIGSKDFVQSSIDVLELSIKVNSMNNDIQTSVSTDAGRYLCEYTYYASLSHSDSRCLFVHVPDLDKPYTAEQTAVGLSRIIKILLTQYLEVEPEQGRITVNCI